MVTRRTHQISNTPQSGSNSRIGDPALPAGRYFVDLRLALCHQPLEPRIVAQAIEVPVVVDPIAMSPTARDRALEQIESASLLSELGMQANRIQGCAHVVGIEFERALDPFERACLLSVPQQ